MMRPRCCTEPMRSASRAAGCRCGRPLVESSEVSCMPWIAGALDRAPFGALAARVPLERKEQQP